MRTLGGIGDLRGVVTATDGHKKLIEAEFPIPYGTPLEEMKSRYDAEMLFVRMIKNLQSCAGVPQENHIA
jgi:hypothetical protein